MKYELLEHTADAKFRAYGKTIEEAFSNAVEAMTAIVADPLQVKHTQHHDLTIHSTSLQKLLFDLLDQILFLMDTEKFMPAKAEQLAIVERNGKFTLSATLVGDDSRKWPHNLKAVTYSEMVVQQEEGRWVLQAVIDI
jgi:SHS2 domain-containing protein